jgi:transposase
MIDAELRRAVAALAGSGMSAREISRRLKISRNTVSGLIARGGAAPRVARPRRIDLDPEMLARLYAECEGYAQRVHEKLLEEERIDVRYSTLTRRLRELGISTPPSRRSARVPDEPGAEMQHDTSQYTVTLAGARASVIASVLYLRYSKRRYLKFYRRFTRFHMKCFLHEALVHWGHAASVCIIDNTNLARLSGAGRAARIAPEMEEFGRRYGFRFRCHEIGHANRKAGEERSFLTVETNFLPGRSFEGLDDLNRQAFEWATVRMEARAQTPARIVPAEAFEEEKPRLIAVPPGLPAPYVAHERRIDQYGYVAFGGNYYWVPGTERGEVKALEYADRLEVYKGRVILCGYALPGDAVRNRRFSPEGMPAPRHGPRNRKRPTAEEEARLRGMSPSVDAFLDRVLAPGGIQRHHFLRRLYALSRRMSEPLFVRSVERAHHYRVNDLDTLERIAHLELAVGEHPVEPPELDEGYRDREAYREGELTDSPDLSAYDRDCADAGDEPSTDGCPHPEEEADGRRDGGEAEGPSPVVAS